jgi:trehalose 6-phosphate phosphatase
MTKPDAALPASESWAFFFDFDGTLVEIASRPDEVVVPNDLGAQLAELAGRAGGALAIITGRRIADIDRLLRPYRLDVAGVHGAELRLAKRTMRTSQARNDRFTKIVSELHERFGSSGLLIEDKGFAAAVHWRSQPTYEADVVKFMNESLSMLGGEYRLQLGKSVAELVPTASRKEIIIERILESEKYRGREPVFFGDDLTDEGGFDFANRSGGISVRVGDGPSVAHYRQPTVAGLRERLKGWAAGAPLNPDEDFVR